MNQYDILLVLAQIGVGVAGFASLATVVGQAYSKTDPEVNSIRLRGLLHIAIAVMLLSFVALTLLRIEALDRSWAWRIASMIALITAVVVSVGVLRRDRPRRKLRANLLMHVILVPLFLAGNLTLIAGLVRWSWIELVTGAGLMFVSMALQARGHGAEAVPPEPFTGASNALARIFLEQWITFPRFVATGGWLRALRHIQTAPNQ
jgi:hypothetical protein